MNAFLPPSPMDLVVDASAPDAGDGHTGRRTSSSVPARPGQPDRWWFAFDRWFAVAAEADDDFVLA